jgi:hypothetical protein
MKKPDESLNPNPDPNPDADPTPSSPSTPKEPPVEADSRFPSGPWKGFFLQPGVNGRQWMELILTFRGGMIRGEGRDRIGKFLFVGRYDLTDGKCWWTKRYVGRHDIAYTGYNEGKGIWGTWEDPKASYWRGGFRIWPEAMGDPYAIRTAEEIEEPELIGVEVGVAVGVEEPAAL